MYTRVGTSSGMRENFSNGIATISLTKTSCHNDLGKRKWGHIQQRQDIGLAGKAGSKYKSDDPRPLQDLHKQLSHQELGHKFNVTSRSQVLR